MHPIRDSVEVIVAAEEEPVDVKVFIWLKGQVAFSAMVNSSVTSQQEGPWFESIV